MQGLHHSHRCGILIPMSCNLTGESAHLSLAVRHVGAPVTLIYRATYGSGAATQLIVPLATSTAGPDSVTRPRVPSSFGVMPMRS